MALNEAAIYGRDMKQRRVTLLDRRSRKYLSSVLDAELLGVPLESQIWRAQHEAQLPTIDGLADMRMITSEDHVHYVATLWGLKNANSENAKDARALCTRVFKKLRDQYRADPKKRPSIEEIAAGVGVSVAEARQAARFLTRSPAGAGVSIHQQEGQDYLTITEAIFRFKNSQDLWNQTRQDAMRPRPDLFGSMGVGGQPMSVLTWSLENSESEIVREAWVNVLARLHTDPARAITAARSMLEAACKHVLAEHGVVDDDLELPKLHREACLRLKLDPEQPDIDDALRQAQRASLTIVNNLAHLRNRLGDAHGRSPSGVKPSKRQTRFIVMLAAANAAFLLETLDAQRN